MVGPTGEASRLRDCHAVRRTLERMLNERFKIAHTTLQVDHAHQQVLSIQRHGVWPSTTS